VTDTAAIKVANADRWAKAKTTRNFTSVARALVEPQAKARYKLVEKRTGVPWYFIAVVHEREASQRWDRQLGQGDPLDKVSVHVPEGRGPFKTWEDGAVDALAYCAPFAARNKDWSIGGLLTLLEQYNGLGYFHKGLPSPYIWSGTDQYKSGKYVRDGVFDPAVIDVQLGCAGLLKAMAALDPSITFTALTSGDTKPPPADLHEEDNQPNLGPPVPQPSFAYAISRLIAFILSLFKRK
jgi:lysozyme family protein